MNIILKILTAFANAFHALQLLNVLESRLGKTSNKEKLSTWSLVKASKKENLRTLQIETKGAYNTDMKKFRKLALASSTVSSELGGTSKYGINPSISSNDNSNVGTGSWIGTPSAASLI